MGEKTVFNSVWLLWKKDGDNRSLLRVCDSKEEATKGIHSDKHEIDCWAVHPVQGRQFNKDV